MGAKKYLLGLYAFVFLYIAAAGGGLWSVDHLLQKDTSGEVHTPQRLTPRGVGTQAAV